jgi:hypothetical protein
MASCIFLPTQSDAKYPWILLQGALEDFDDFFKEQAEGVDAWGEGYGDKLRDDLRSKLIDAWSVEATRNIGLWKPGSD